MAEWGEGGPVGGRGGKRLPSGGGRAECCWLPAFQPVISYEPPSSSLPSADPFAVSQPEVLDSSSEGATEAREHGHTFFELAI